MNILGSFSTATNDKMVNSSYFSAETPEEIDDFYGNRNITSNNFRDLLCLNVKNIPQVVYRGLMLSKDSIVLSGVIEEWNNMTHWSPDLDVAYKFLKLILLNF